MNFKCLLKVGFNTARKRFSIFIHRLEFLVPPPLRGRLGGGQTLCLHQYYFRRLKNRLLKIFNEFKCLLKVGFNIAARKRFSTLTPCPSPKGRGEKKLPSPLAGEVRWGANIMFASILMIEMNMTKNICIEFNKLRPCGKPDIFHKIKDFGKSSQINSG